MATTKTTKSKTTKSTAAAAPAKPASKYTAFRCPSDLLDKAKAAARADRRSLSGYIIKLIADACNK